MKLYAWAMEMKCIKELVFGAVAVLGSIGAFSYASAATVISSVHYQQSITLICASLSCNGDFAKPGLNRQLNITRVSCIMTGSAGSTFDLGVINLLSAAKGLLLQEAIPVDFSSSEGAHSINSAVDLQIVGAQHAQVSLALTTGTAKFGFCTATGILSKLG